MHGSRTFDVRIILISNKICSKQLIFVRGVNGGTFIEEGKYKNNVLVTSSNHKRHMFLVR